MTTHPRYASPDTAREFGDGEPRFVRAVSGSFGIPVGTTLWIKGDVPPGHFVPADDSDQDDPVIGPALDEDDSTPGADENEAEPTAEPGTEAPMEAEGNQPTENAVAPEPPAAVVSDGSATTNEGAATTISLDPVASEPVETFTVDAPVETESAPADAESETNGDAQGEAENDGLDELDKPALLEIAQAEGVDVHPNTGEVKLRAAIRAHRSAQ